MKIFRFLIVFILVASLLVPVALFSPSIAEAESACQWGMIDTPGLGFTSSDIVAGSEINRMVIGPDDSPLLVSAATPFFPTLRLYISRDNGRSWGGSSQLLDAMRQRWGTAVNVWDVAVAPDNSDVWAVVSSNPDFFADYPSEVWYTWNGGDQWMSLGFLPSVGECISCIAISPVVQHGYVRNLLVGTRDGSGNGDIYVMRAPGSLWTAQGLNADIYQAQFSPAYDSDGCIVTVASGDAQSIAGVHDDTMLYLGFHDIAEAQPVTNWTTWRPVEIKDPLREDGDSPGVDEMITADMELPSDFCGQEMSTRRVYVSLNADNTVNVAECNTGIYRIDDTVVYVLMDTTKMFTVANGARRISSIAYWGTYSSGKLMAGEVVGYQCKAIVDTWITDTPTVCHIPCWYQALKPTTGAAGNDACTVNSRGYGNAQVLWSPRYAERGVAYVGTGSASLGPYATPNGAIGVEWPEGYLNVVSYDESAFGLSRNNGETWNQLSLIDTEVTKFTDVAPSADCSTLYLASTNDNTGCTGFDSVWRSSIIPDVNAPLAAIPPIGTYWERVLCHVTAVICEDDQSEHAIIRLPSDKQDGQVAFWAAGGTTIDSGTTTIGSLTVGANTTAVMWTADYGDFWTNIDPRIPVQDLAAASSTLIYVLDTTGRVQRMPYTGSGWSSAVNTTDTGISGHMLLTWGGQWVLVGNNDITGPSNPVAYSENQGETFDIVYRPANEAGGRVHIEYDKNFAENKTIYAAYDDADGDGRGSIYRWQLGTSTDWVDLLQPPAACGTLYSVGQYGLAVAFNGHNGKGALYSAHLFQDPDITTGVLRQLYPDTGMPLPGMAWDDLNIFNGSTTSSIDFTEEPWSLKLCGCLTSTTDTSVFALDNNLYGGRNMGPGMGDLWVFDDCLSKRGPVLVGPENGAVIGCDPATGRSQEVNFGWEQLCLSRGYDIEIAKDSDFNLLVFDWVSPCTVTSPEQNFYIPPEVTDPAFIYPFSAIGDNLPAYVAPVVVSELECGHRYYWRVQARYCATEQVLRSPFSEVRTFTIKAGFPVTTPYYGVVLLSPSNGCTACSEKYMAFSWAPFKETTGYVFTLAKDAAMTDVVVERETSTTGFEYRGDLEDNTNYFWRVRASQPAPSEWSATFSFLTAPVPETLPTPSPAATTPLWVWVIIAVGSLLAVVIIILIIKTRRV